MTLPPFDGSAYRRTVLTPLRSASPAAVDDVFLLGGLPRDVDDPALVAARLKATKAFLHKERARPRQADVAAAVLKEWPRVEGVLTDAAARRSLRLRLRHAEEGAGAMPVSPPRPTGAPGDRRFTQVEAALGELARLRDEPDLAEDLFAFLGLPLGATSAMVSARLNQIADANRRRRPDRERSLTDELVVHARALLVDGDPAVYRARLDGTAPPRTSAPEVAPPESIAPEPPPSVPEAASRKLSFDRAASAPPGPPSTPLVAQLAVRRDGADVVATWSWPEGVTEAFVSVGEGSGPSAPGPGGRKITNMKYELDGGARLSGVPAGTPIRVHTGRRDARGALGWNAPLHARETIAP